jgi:hypothetical protein
VPLATLTGWQFRSEQIGAPSTLIAMAGAYVPLPATKAERERRKDPRMSVAERYPAKADYLAKTQAAATKLADDRYILKTDVPAIVKEAGALWDLVMGTGSATASNQAAR